MFKNRAKYIAGVLAIMLAASLAMAGCSIEGSSTGKNAAGYSAGGSGTEGSSLNLNSKILAETADMFTERDLIQTVDLADAISFMLKDSEDIHISEAGVYVLNGIATDMTVYIEAAASDTVQIVLDGVSVTNSDMPCIYVLSADKVFITTSADSNLSVTGAFAESSGNADAVIFSCEDIVFNGSAELSIESGDVGVDSKDDLKFTGGSYTVNAVTKAFEANDSIRIAAGTFNLTAGTDGLHAENDDDDSKGYIYIADGNFNINSGDDGVQAVSFVQIDGGSFKISAVEGIEASYVQINGGSFDISASDDGINASEKSTSYAAVIEITGGECNIVMGAGDTDALDSNGDLIISGGRLNITANSAFDYDGTGIYT